MIVRAIGPSLAQHGITNPLQDPTLELHDHNGALIAYNDNWISAPNKQAIINSGHAPSNNLESAILKILSPGNYTAIVRGKNGAYRHRAGRSIRPTVELEPLPQSRARDSYWRIENVCGPAKP